jgi:chitin synthase
MYRIKAPKGGQNYWVPILANPDVVEHYSENVVDTLHKKNLLLLGEDRYLSTLMLRTFPKRKQIFVPQAVCKTVVPDNFMVLLSQRRRWINSTVHNLMELVLVRDLCGTFCFSMQFVVFIELVGTLVLPAAIAFTFYVVIISIVRPPVQVIPLVLLGLILGLPGVLIIVTAHRLVYVLWMLIYLISLPIWNFVLPTYAYWKFDDFSWGDTRKTAGEQDKGHEAGEGEFDSSKITMKRWRDFERGMMLSMLLRMMTPTNVFTRSPNENAECMGAASFWRSVSGTIRAILGILSLVSLYWIIIMTKDFCNIVASYFGAASRTMSYTICPALDRVECTYSFSGLLERTAIWRFERACS